MKVSLRSNLHVSKSMLFFFFFWMSLMIQSPWVRPVWMWTNTFFVEGTSQSVKQSGCVHAIHFQQTGYVILSFNQLSDNTQFNCLRKMNPYQTKKGCVFPWWRSKPTDPQTTVPKSSFIKKGSLFWWYGQSATDIPMTELQNTVWNRLGRYFLKAWVIIRIIINYGE